MSRNLARPAAPPHRRRWPLRLALLVLAGVLAVALALAALVIETRPRVAAAGTPDAGDAERARALASGLRDFIETEGAAGSWSVDASEAQAALNSAARLVDGLRGEAEVAQDAAWVTLSLGDPFLPRGLWLNLHLALLASEDGLELGAAEVGRLSVPPWAALWAGRMLADRALGRGGGQIALDGLKAVRINPPEVAFHFDLAPEAQAALFERLRTGVKALGGGTDRDRVEAHLNWLHDGPDEGYLDETGSVAPFLRGVLERAVADPGEGVEDRVVIQSAFFAIALYCGDHRFRVAIGMGMPPRMEEGRNRCRQRVTLGGRDDLKRHFLLSAGLEAASGGATATLGFGELKELLDSNEGGTGFSFDDMAANSAGTRFAAAWLAAPRADWPAMLARVETEADLLPRLDDLPSGMSEAEFSAEFGRVDSARYAELLAEIERRVDALPFHRALAGG